MGAWTQTGSSIIFIPFTLEQALAGLAEAGFVNVEIGAVKGFLEHLDPDDCGPAEVANCRRLLDEHGLTCVSMSGHAPLHLDIGVQRLTNVLGVGKELGIQVLNTFTGDASRPRRSRRSSNVRAIADEAQDAGIRLCIETDSNLLPTAAVGRGSWPRSITRTSASTTTPETSSTTRVPSRRRTSSSRCRISGTST